MRDRTADELSVFLRQLFTADSIDHKKITAIIIASVVPSLDFTCQRMCEKFLGPKPVFVNNTMDFGLTIKYNPPSAVGADRLVDAAAGAEIYGVPCIIVDFGTATKFEVVNSKREYLGGAITAGINLMADSLSTRTAKLPRAEIKRPENVIGNSTVGSIQTGLYYGYAGLVDGILKRMIEELNAKTKVIATGGLAPLIWQASQFIEGVNENLMLEGLRIIHKKVKK